MLFEKEENKNDNFTRQWRENNSIGATHLIKSHFESHSRLRFYVEMFPYV